MRFLRPLSALALSGALAACGSAPVNAPYSPQTYAAPGYGAPAAPVAMAAPAAPMAAPAADVPAVLEAPAPMASPYAAAASAPAAYPAPAATGRTAQIRVTTTLNGVLAGRFLEPNIAKKAQTACGGAWREISRVGDKPVRSYTSAYPTVYQTFTVTVACL